MSGCNQWALLKVVEVILCISCLCYKWWTDEEASRLFFLLEKNSREWPLQNNVTWNQAGSWFADVVFGGYAIITVGLFVAHIMGELRYTRKTETFLLGFGAVLFFGAGCMIITSFDNVPDGLIDNAIILGLLAIFTGIVFIVDVCCLRSRVQTKKTTNPENEIQIQYEEKVVVADGKGNSLAVSKVPADKAPDKVIAELKSSIKQKNVEEKTTTQRVTADNEQKETREKGKYGRKNSQSRSFSVGENSNGSNWRVECNNSYDYDVQCIKKYESEVGTSSTNSGHDDSCYDYSSVRYNEKSGASQTERKQYTNDKLVVERHRRTKDAESTTDASGYVTKSVFVNGVLQSSKISTTNPHNSDSPTSEEGYKIQPAAGSSYRVSGGNKFQGGPNAINPSSPTHPEGYVLRTAAKWPNASILGPIPYQKWKQTRILNTVQTAV